MDAVIAKIMTVAAVAGVAAVIALSTGKSALGAEIQTQTGAQTGIASAVPEAVLPVTDFSARKKRYRYRSYGTYPFGFGPSRYYHGGANPNYGPGTRQMLQARRQNRCVMDEGYGRWFSCSNN